MTEADTVLVERLTRGDEAAFETLFLRHYRFVHRVLYRLLGNTDQAEDVAQEVFLTLYRQPPHANAQVSVLAWLCRVALNRGYNMLRGDKRTQQRIERLGRLEQPDVFDPDAELLRTESQQQVRAALSELPERQARLLALRYAGLAYSEIASALEIAPSSVGSLLARAEKAFVAAYERTQLVQTIGNQQTTDDMV